MANALAVRSIREPVDVLKRHEDMTSGLDPSGDLVHRLADGRFTSADRGTVTQTYQPKYASW
jgi:hypothetical protein